MRRRFIQSLLALPLLSLPGCARRAGPLRFGAGPWTGYLGLRLAGQRLAQSGLPLRLLDLPNASAVLAAMRNGLLDAAALSLDEVMLLLGSEQHLRVVLVLDVSRGAHALIGHERVTSLYELPGLRLGVETEALGAYMLTRVLDLAGVATERVDIVTLPADQHESAFLQRSVDAVLTYEPMRQRLLAAGGRELFSSRQITGEMVDVVVVRTHALDEHGDTLTALLRSCLQSGQELASTPEQVAQALRGRVQLSQSELIRAVADIEVPDLQQNWILLGRGKDSLQVRAERMLELMHGRALLAPELNLPADLMDARHLPEGVP